MDNVYYVFNALVLVPVLLLSIFTDVQPHRAWRALLTAYLCVSLPFIVWDVWAAAAGHWGFNSRYISGPYIAGIPIEEILFFITVPFAMMYVWGVIQKHVVDTPVPAIVYKTILGAVGVASAVLLVTQWGQGYTRSAAFAALLTVLFLATSKLVTTKRFWVFQVALFGLFIACNLILTALPVITYGDSSIIGVRFITIPVEDFFFNFALINLFLLVYAKMVDHTNTLTK